jgi:hypothetical protein
MATVTRKLTTDEKARVEFLAKRYDTITVVWKDGEPVQVQCHGPHGLAIMLMKGVKQ